MRRLLITAAIALSAVSLAGCSAGSMPSSVSDGGAPSVGEGAPSVPVAPAPDLGKGYQTPGSDALIGPQIITTVQLTVTVEAPIEAADEAAHIVDRVGGTVASRTERAASDQAPGQAQLSLRIPSAKLTATLEELKQLGTARDTSINSTDVTTQAEDLDARITALQTSVDRLLSLMSKATSTQDLITIESALSDRQANLESLEAQKRSLDDQVQLSTVSLSLVSEKDVPAETPDTFWTGLVTGWNTFVGFVGVALVVIGVLIPWVIAGGVVTAIVLVWVKLAKTRKARRAAQLPAA
ncbi:MAG TPA: DUF4349 domain-containing protein [Terrimesophilobacter sp.]|jgi:hypothetical protein|uniref:DUF4349 domain-containing protein n=1 Tax=Terrimesophilobacter sp. TaxID=2906435 RepID=UPI002F93D99A